MTCARSNVARAKATKTVGVRWRSMRTACASTSVHMPRRWAAWTPLPSLAEWGRTAPRSAQPACSGWTFSPPRSSSSEQTKSWPWRCRRRPCSRLIPLPVLDLRHVVAVARDVLAMLDQLVAHALPQVCRLRAETRDVIDHGFDQMIAIEIVQHRHVERRRRGAFFLVTAHVQVGVAMTPVGQAMDQPRIAVKREQDRLVDREDRIEFRVRQPMRMLARRLQRHQVDDVDDADLQRRQPLA